MGGKSKSSSSSSSKIRQEDRRIAAADNAVVVTERGRLTVVNESVDAEVIEASLSEVFDFASGAGDTAGGLVGNALDLVEDANKRALEAQSSVGELGSLKEILKAGTAVAVVAAAAFTLTRMK